MQPVTFPDLDSILSALGALDPMAEAALAERRRADPELDADIRRWERRFAALAGAAPSEGLWDRINGAIDAAEAASRGESPTDTGRWTAVGEGLSIQVLTTGGAGAPRTVVLHAAAGSILSSWPALAGAVCLVLSGEVTGAGERFGRGETIAAGAGQGELRSVDGAVLYVCVAPA